MEQCARHPTHLLHYYNPNWNPPSPLHSMHSTFETHSWLFNGISLDDIKLCIYAFSFESVSTRVYSGTGIFSAFYTLYCSVFSAFNCVTFYILLLCTLKKNVLPKEIRRICMHYIFIKLFTVPAPLLAAHEYNPLYIITRKK